MIHDDLTRHFRALPEPELSAEFDAVLRRRLEAGRRTAGSSLIRGWAMRGYWIAAAALVFFTVRPTLAPGHVVAIAVVALLSMLALQRALGPTPLTRILRDALR